MKRATTFRRAGIAATAAAALLLPQIALAQSPQTAHPVAPWAPPPQRQVNQYGFPHADAMHPAGRSRELALNRAVADNQTISSRV